MSRPVEFNSKRGLLTFEDGTSLLVGMQEPLNGCTAIILEPTDPRRANPNDTSTSERVIFDVEFRGGGQVELCLRGKLSFDHNSVDYPLAQ